MRASERGTRRARESRETPYRFSTRSLRRYAASQLLSEGLEQVTSVCKLISKMFYYYYFFFFDNPSSSGVGIRHTNVVYEKKKYSFLHSTHVKPIAKSSKRKLNALKRLRIRV